MYNAHPIHIHNPYDVYVQPLHTNHPHSRFPPHPTPTTPLPASHPIPHHPGLDVETGTPTDLGAQEIFDLFSTKWWALRLAADAAVTVLRVDQIIMSKQAGGPKPPKGGNADED